jgi:pimeloyl-ACP methyl ester carboxylesterase
MNKKIKFDASRLAVATGGAGEPAVFVHGFGSSKSTWRHVRHGLNDVFSFYAIDLPGSGKSPAPRHFHYTLEHFADVLTDFIILKDLKKLTLVGASFGATIILLALLRNGDELGPRVRALCLINAVAYPQDFPFFIEILRTPVLGPFALNFPFFPKIYARRGVRVAIIKTARLLNAKRLARYVERFKTIHLPTLVIWGRRDSLVPLRVGKRLARDLPNSRLVVIDDCGHSPHTECPAKVIAALKEFAQKTSENVSPN